MYKKAPVVVPPLWHPQKRDQAWTWKLLLTLFFLTFLLFDPPTLGPLLLVPVRDPFTAGFFA